MTPEEKTLNEKIALWCGYKRITGRYYGCLNPQKKEMVWPDYCHSLDALFRDVVPKLYKTEIHQSENGRGFVYIEDADYESIIEQFAATSNAALALATAIGKLIDAQEAPK